MEIGIWVALAVVSAAISYYLRPKLPGSAARELADFGPRQETELYRGKVMPLVYGRMRLAATLLFFGGKRAFAIDDQGREWADYLYPVLWENEAFINGVSAFRYGATALYGVCLAPKDTNVEVRKILCDGRVIWSGSQSSGTINIGTTREVPFTYADVNLDDTINVPVHGSFTGDSFILVKNSGSLPVGTGIANGAQLFVIVVNDNEIKWATTRDNAIANTPINITNIGTGEHRMHFGDRRTITSVDVGTDKLTSPGHGMKTGHGPIRLQALAGGTLPSPLKAGRDYWVIKTSADEFRVALSYGEALRQEYVLLATAGTGTRVAWIQPDTSQFFGGPLRGGGLRGTIYWLPGSLTQEAPAPLKNVFDMDSVANPDYDSLIVPGFRDCACALFTGFPWRFPVATDRGASTGFDFGESGNIPEFTFEVQAVPENIGDWAETDGGDANPIEVWYDLMTETFSRLGYDPARIDDTALGTAAATLEAEGLLMSCALSDKQEAEAIIKQIAAHADCVFYEEQSTGKVVVELIREYTGDIGDLESYGPDDVIGEPEYGRPLWGLTFTKSSVRFHDRESDYQPDVAEWQDGSGAGLRGHTATFPFTVDPETARALAQRSGIARRRPMAAIKIPLSRRAAQHRPGDRIVWVWPDASISQMVLVVHEVDLGSYHDGTVWLTCTQDRFRSAYVGRYPRPKPPPAVSSSGSFTEVFPDGQDLAMEAPAFYEVRSGLQEPGSGLLMFLPSSDQHQIAAVETSEDGALFQVDRSMIPMVPLAALRDDPLEIHHTSITLENFVLPDPNSTWQLFRSVCADLVERDATNLLLIGDPEGEHEFAALVTGSYDPDTAFSGPFGYGTVVQRGLLDTPARQWPIGTPVRFVGALGVKVLGQKRLTCAPGDLTEVVIKMRPATGFGASDTNAVGTRTVSLVGRGSLPIPPAGLLLQQRVSWADRPTGATDLKDVTQEGNPGINGQNVLQMGDDGDDDRVGMVVQNELYSEFKRRSRASGRVLSTSAADETPSVTTQYRHEAKGDSGDSYTVADTVTQGGEWIGLEDVPFSDGDLEGAVQAVGEELDALGDPVNESLFPARIAAEIARSRQLLYNPSFQDDDGSGGARAWTTTDGGPAFTNDGPNGSRCFSGGSDGENNAIQQDRAVVAQVPGAATRVRATWLQRRSGDVEQVHVRVVNRIGGSDGALVIDNDTVPASADYWERITQIGEEDPGPGLDTDTEELRTLVEISGTDALVAGLDVRLDEFYDFADETWLANLSFNGGSLHPWETTGGGTSARNTTEQFEGAGCLEITADEERYQVSSSIAAASPAAGDILFVSCALRSMGDDENAIVIVELLDSGSSVLMSRTADSINTSSDYQLREFWLKLPANVDKVKLRCIGSGTGGANYALFDDFQVVLFKQS